MIEIPLYNTFSKIEPITKGMSGDKKYYIETIDGKHLLLRVADYSEYTQKQIEFEVLKHMLAQGVPMPSPIDFGVCDNGKSVYTLLSWVDDILSALISHVTNNRPAIEEEKALVGVKNISRFFNREL